MSDPVIMMITQAGLRALVDGDIANPILITQIGLTQAPFIVAPTIDALPGEFKRLSTVSGAAVSDAIIHMTATDGTSDIYDLCGIGLYLDDGTLFAVYSQPTPIFRKVSISSFLFALDVTFGNGTGNISFGDATFLLPPATEETAGLARIATNDQADAGTDDRTIISPKKLRRLLDALATVFGGDLDGLNAIVAALLARTINGSGLVTGGGDLSASRTLHVTAATGGETIAGTATDRAITPAALFAFRSTIAFSGGGLVKGGGNLALSRTLTVDAATSADVASGTATDKAITPAALSGLARSLGQNGYAYLPGTGGLILQWGRFSAPANTTTNTLFPVAFPIECFAVTPCGGAAGGADSQDNPPVLVTSGITRSGFAVFSADDTTAGMAYLAIGI